MTAFRLCFLISCILSSALLCGQLIGGSENCFSLENELQQPEQLWTNSELKHQTVADDVVNNNDTLVNQAGEKESDDIVAISDCDCQGCADSWNIWIFPDYFYFGLTEGKGIGFHRGYATLGGFITPDIWSTPRLRSFVDAKGYAFLEGNWAATVGTGTRYLLPKWDIVLGANIYYDYRKFHHFDLNQVGLGVEILSPILDFRANGYIPINCKRYKDTLFDFSDGFFAIRRKQTIAWRGVDAEVGAWIKRKHDCDWLGIYFACGPYYYFHQHKGHFEEMRHHCEIVGGRARLLARICDFVDISINVTYDSRWHTRTNGQIMVTIPFDWMTSLGNQRSEKCTYGCCCQETPCLLNQIAIQPVQRQGIIVADQECCWLWNWSDDGSDCDSYVSSCSSSGRPSSRSISLSSSLRSFPSSFRH